MALVNYMKNIVLTILIIFWSLNVVTSQRDSRNQSISINVPSFLSFTYPNIDIGYQYEFNNWYSMELGIGIIYPLSSFDEDEVGTFKHKGSSIRVESKFNCFEYELKSKITYELFLGLKYYYTDYNYISRRYIEDRNSNEKIQYNVNSTINSGNFLIGIKTVEGNFFHEVSTGIGWRFLSINNDAEKNISEYSNRERWLPYFTPEEKGKYRNITFRLI